jgi:hypothetical protein
MSKIKIIAHPETGKMFTATSNPEWVKCQLQSEEIVVNNGVIQLQKRVAFPLVSSKVAEALAGLKSGAAFPLDGKIIRRVSATPQYDGHKQVINPATKEEMGYYQSFEFSTLANAKDVDERIDVVEASEQKEVATPQMQPNTAFDEA